MGHLTQMEWEYEFKHEKYCLIDILDIYELTCLSHT